MLELRLSPPGFPWRFDLLLALSRRVPFPARAIVVDDVLWRYCAGVRLAFRQEGDVIVGRGSGITDENQAGLIEASRRALGMHRDLGAFYACARRDEALWRVIEPLVGLPAACAETVFEALITLIIEQHITWRSAARAQQTLLRLCDSRAAQDHIPVYDFPTPCQIAGMTRQALKPLKITNRRIDLLLAIARQVCGGVLDLERLRLLEPTEAYAALLEIKGVGHWTAANVIGRAFGKHPFVSHNDVALQTAVNHYFYAGAGEKSARQVRDTMAAYGEFAGLASHFTLLRWVLDRYPPISQIASSS